MGTVQGVVRAGPCINAEPTTPSSSCPGTPIANGKVDFTAAGATSAEVAVTGVDGSYRISLDPGTYTVKVEGRVFNVSNPGETKSVTVTAGTTTTLNLFVDTGIRGPAPATP